MWFLIIIAGFFGLIGLITFSGWLFGMNRSRDEVVRQQVADQLRERAAQYQGKTATELLAVASGLVAGLPYVPPRPTQHAAPRQEPAKPAPVASQIASLAHRDITDVFASMDNINLLLFLGAFLIVVSAGIYVGYNFQSLTGLTKVAFLFLTTAAFYVTGLVLYLAFTKLRPAGSTFTGIGLVLMPFVGVAAYNFTGAHAHGSFVWLLTSVICFLLYIITLLATRQTYIAFLMGLTTLSLFESTVSLIHLPVYWFSWAAALTGIVLMTLGRTRRLWHDASSAISATAHVFIPISLLFSLWLTTGRGLTQFGVTAALAGFFYFMLMLRETNRAMADHYFAAAAFAVPIAFATGLWDHTPRYVVVGVMLLLALAALYAVARFAKALAPYPHSTRRMTLAILAGGLPLAAVPMDAASARALVAALVGAVAVNAALAVILRQVTYALIAELASLLVPLAVFDDLVHPHFTAGQMTVVYLILAALLLGWRHTMRRWDRSQSFVGLTGYLAALVAAFVAAASSGHAALIVVGGIAAVALFALSYYEPAPEYVYLAAASAYLAATQVVAAAHFYNGAYAIALTLVGLLAYAAGSGTTLDSRRARSLQVAGIIGPYAAAVLGFAGSMGNAAPGALAAGAALTFLEGYRRHNASYMELSVAILLVAADWLLNNQGVSQTQYYTLPWSVYFGVLAWRRHDDASARDLFAALALAALTLPIAGQALQSNGQYYGLELIVFGLLIALIGSTIRYKLMLWWGVATLVAEVLYQMRDYLFALPKYVISAALGLALLAAAIVLLQRRRQ